MIRKKSNTWRGSKWSKTQLLVRHRQLKPFIPTTKPFNKKTLYSMLKAYNMVYMKPDRGTFGNGVIKLEKMKRSLRYQYKEMPRTFSTYQAMYDSLKRKVGERNYLVQKGVHLLKFKNRRFDIRVMVQKNPRGKWETTGIIGRLGHPRKIVTNYHSGGTPMSVDTLLRPHLNHTKTKTFKMRLNRLGLKVAEQFQRRSAAINELGLDIGVDRDIFPHILEVNTKPDPYIFNQLTNKSMYRKVIRYAKVYGRVK